MSKLSCWKIQLSIKNITHKNPSTVSTYTKTTPTIQTNDDRQTDSFECHFPRLGVSTSCPVQSTQSFAPDWEQTWQAAVGSLVDLHCSGSALAIWLYLASQWHSVNTTPSSGLAHQLKQCIWVWCLEPAGERFRGWLGWESVLFVYPTR